MKTGHITIIGWLLLFGVTLLFSCIKNDEPETSRHYRLTIKAIDPDSESIKNNVILYFFDSDQKLEKTSKVSIDTESTIDGLNRKQYTIIAVGYSAEMQLPVIEPGTTIAEAKIELTKGTFANHTIATSPGDILHGTLAVQAGCDEVNQTIWIKRKVAALTIITRSLQSELATTDENFSYVVRETHGTLGIDGQFKGDKVAYHPTSSFANVNKDLVAPKFYTYPLNENDQLNLDIYKDTTLNKSYTIKTDQPQSLLKEGKHTVLILDYKKDSISGDDALLNVTIRVLDWIDSDINEGFN